MRKEDHAVLCPYCKEYHIIPKEIIKQIIEWYNKENK